MTNISGRRRVSAARIPTEAAVARLDEIKAAAARLFYQRGYHATDLRLIAAEVGLHPSSFYNYIESKQEVLYLIMRDGIDALNEGLGQAIDGVEGPIVAVRRAIAFHVTWCSRNRYLAWTQMAELRSLEEPWRREIIARRDQYQARWIAMVERGVANGDFRPVNVKLVVFSILGMLSSVARWYRPRGPARPHDIAESFAAMVIDGLRRGAIAPVDEPAVPVASAELAADA